MGNITDAMYTQYFILVLLNYNIQTNLLFFLIFCFFCNVAFHFSIISNCYVSADKQ